MNFNLCATNDINNVINKTINLVEIINIRLRRDFNFNDLNILVRINSIDKINSINYLTIPDLNLFYFINEKINRGNNLYNLIGSKDLLEIYKNDILKSECYFKREIKEGDFNNISVDDNLKVNEKIISSDFKIEYQETFILSSMGESKK